MSFEELDDAVDEDDAHVDDTYLTFRVGAEEYAVPVTCVTEIVRLQKSFAVPDVPPCVRGVINLRGKVIPLLDVRQRFGFDAAVYTDRTVVVVLEFADAATGLIVDGVSEVVEIAPEHIEVRATWPGRGAGGRSMVRAIGKRAQTVSFILDVAALLDAPAAQPPAAIATPNAP